MFRPALPPRPPAAGRAAAARGALNPFLRDSFCIIALFLAAHSHHRTLPSLFAPATDLAGQLPTTTPKNRPTTQQAPIMPPIELTFGRRATEVGTSPQGGVEAAEEPQMDMLAFAMK